MKRILYLITLTYILLPCITLAKNVGKWDRFEEVITNNNKYADPFKDVNLNVTYTKPSGEQIKFFGFYDGDTTWRFRFMPDEIGTWKYTAKFSDNTKEINGTFNCVESDIPGMISLDETTPRWFGFKGGKHILIRSFHCGYELFKEKTSAEKRKIFLDWIVENKYNMLSIGNLFTGSNYAGHTQFLWKDGKLHPEEYRKQEKILDEIASRKIIVYPFGGFFRQSGSYPKKSDEQELYIKYTIARYAPYWNMIFTVAGPEVNKRNYIKQTDLQRLSQLVIQYDVFKHPIGSHYYVGNDPNKDANWQTYTTLQGLRDTCYEDMFYYILRNHHSKKPVYAQECIWFGAVYQANHTEEQARRLIWITMMAGAAYNLGDMAGENSTGFSGSLDPKDAIMSRHNIAKNIWDFMESIPFYEMNINPHFVNKGYCLSKSGEYYLVYLPHGGSVNIDVKKANYSVTLINARNTKEQIKLNDTNDGQNLKTPDTQDWLLYLKRK